MLDKAIYAGLCIVAVAALGLAFLSTSPSFEDCMVKVGNADTCHYALR